MQHSPQCFSANIIIRLLQIHQCNMQFLPFFSILLNQLLQYKYLIYTSPTRPKSSLLLRYLFFRTFYHSLINISRYTQYIYSSVISTISPVIFPFEYRDDTRCLRILCTTPGFIHLLNILSNQSVMLIPPFFNISTIIPSIPVA